MEGKILHNRYKILHPIGIGGMAEVYLARDMLLDREVAVKILRAQFIGDKSLVEQFKREAQSAARLVHPSIINIFDVCEENNIYFIVMEHVNGCTLKTFLEENGPMKPFWAVHIACELAAALEHAHGRNIIHCDIKPHNILINQQFTPKIADFGIARMVSNQTMVYTAAVIGSVHYLSPEQAGGNKVTEQSDLYSLGIVLYEMLTGRVPFDGNTAAAVAMMQIEKTPPPLSEFVINLPECLQKVVDRALAKNPKDRYATAEEMRQDLSVIKNTMLQENAEEDYYEIVRGAPMQDSSMVRCGTEAPDETLIMMAPFNQGTKHDDISKKSEDVDGVLTKTTKSHKKYWMLAVGVVLFSMIFLLAGTFFSRKTVTVPSVVGKTVVEAQKLLEKDGFRIKLTEEYDKNTIPGYVMKQEPADKELRKEGSIITLIVSKGLDMEQLPDVIGIKYDLAKLELEKKGYAIGDISSRYDDSKPINIVLSQSPQGKSITPKGSKVDIVINKERKDLLMPNLIGNTLNNAKDILTGMGIVDIGIRYVDNNSKAGHIIGIEPPAGNKLNNSGRVELQVSSGKNAPINKYVEFVVPQGNGLQDIQIMAIDDNGQKLVYQGVQKPGVRIRQKIEVNGIGRVQFYINNKLIEEKNL